MTPLPQVDDFQVEESGASLIPGFAYSAPFQDLEIKK
jgi:hypothetical protein